ncbi:unnamed protein product [Linum trigynum]|uniref:Uncharacterized protein n=1 Tax=Linum trigynum TaxID=586398 RepID=A0AAV2D7S0_9ROSI
MEELRVREINLQLRAFDIASQVQLEAMPVHLKGLSLRIDDFDGAVWKHMNDRERSRTPGMQLSLKESQAGVV